jgi:hypothetical protein
VDTKKAKKIAENLLTTIERIKIKRSEQLKAGKKRLLEKLIEEHDCDYESTEELLKEFYTDVLSEITSSDKSDKKEGQDG